MLTQFASSQTVDITVPAQPVPIQHYLRQPHRVIRALVDPKQTERLSAEVFRLKMRPLRFVTFTLQPTVDMKLWADPDGTVHLRSVGCKIQGVSFIDRRFHLNLVGILAPKELNGKPHLRGKADLKVEVDIPPPLLLTPRPIIETTGNGLLASVLMTIKQRLMHHLIADYCRWAATQAEPTDAAPASILSADHSAI